LRIYTRTGDQGQTSLLGRERVTKADARVEVCGTLDETNAALGVARALGLPEPVDAVIARVQRQLLAAGAEVAAVPPARARGYKLGSEEVAWLEGAIDAHELELEPLSVFVLPGGTPGGAALHFARTVCRRAERALVAAWGGSAEGSHLFAYLNRLSDLLFVLARRANAMAGVGEVRWNPQSPRLEG
jgi:cob(I)alamin adenosyltransferase